MPDDDAPREAGGQLWFTVEQAARWLGRSPWTIYSWRRRGLLPPPARDEHGQQIYSQRQLATAEKQARPRAARILDRAA